MSGLFGVILAFVCVGFWQVSGRFFSAVFGEPLHPVGIWAVGIAILPLFVWFLFLLAKDLISVFRGHKN